MPARGNDIDPRFIVKPGPPAYRLLGTEALRNKIEKSRQLASPCVLCGRKCRVRRFDPEDEYDYHRGMVLGICRTGKRAVVSSYGPHYGEEPPITGWRGSGTIFFSFCNLKCIFCQNYEIAHLGEGQEVEDHELAAMMLELQELGCHNVNLVSPTHVVPQILSAVLVAMKKGLNIPIVYNTGGYDSVETIRLLDGVVDIYMPDMKYGTSEAAEKYSLAPDYPSVNFSAVEEMHRQVGDLTTDENGIAVRGLLVRHLVLPGNVAGTERVLKFLAENISKDTYVNIMDQYRPYYRAVGDPVLGRRITKKEYREVLDIAKELGLRRVLAN